MEDGISFLCHMTKLVNTEYRAGLKIIFDELQTKFCCATFFFPKNIRTLWDYTQKQIGLQEIK